jgi:NitT/TauT family transport system ATP-binding protein
MEKEQGLKLSGISKSFARTDTNEITHALSNVNLNIKNGEFISIVGPSGCGKSTILRMIAGLIAPTTGEITLNGEIVEGTSANRGMAFQKPTLFPWLTVEDNISFGLRMQNKMHDKSDVDRMIEMIGLSDFKKSYPHQLSGGMAQRVSLVRTMINKPEVFLLDEPLGALDAFTRMNMQDELINMWKEDGNIMIMVTHDVDEAIYMGNRVLVMAPRPGRVVDDIQIELEYPRNRNSKKFLQYRTKIMEMLDFGKSETESESEVC